MFLVTAGADYKEVFATLPKELQRAVNELWSRGLRASVGTIKGGVQRKFTVMVEYREFDMLGRSTSDIVQSLIKNGLYEYMQGFRKPARFFVLTEERMAHWTRLATLPLDVRAVLEQVILAHPTAEIKCCDGHAVENPFLAEPSQNCVARNNGARCPRIPHAMLRFCRVCSETCDHGSLEDSLLESGWSKGATDPRLGSAWWLYPHINEQRIYKGRRNETGI